MKKLIFSILLLASTLLQASDIYVKPGESIADAIRQARELRRLNDPSIEGGITIHVAAGNYRIYEPLFLRPEDSGTPSSPTIIKGEGEVIVSGGVTVTGWKRQGKLMVADVPDFCGRPLDFRQFYVNGKKAVRARDVADFEDMYRIIRVDKQKRVLWVPAAAVRKIQKAPYAEMVLHEMWCVANLRIKDIMFAGDSAAVSFHDPESRIQFEHPWPCPMVTTDGHNSAFYLTNARELLDVPKSGHPGGSLSAADIYTYLYFEELNIDPKDPKKADRDRFVLSKGHTAPGYYSALAHRGFFPVEDLKTLRHTGSYLQGHPDMKHIPGVDMSSGSLGQGISAAVGMAISAKLSNDDYRVYTLLGDGEIQEGQVWEASMLAGFKKLDNLVVIVDNNNLQIDGRIDEVNSPYPIDKKFEAFNFHVINIDGHDFDQIAAAFKEAKETKGMPTAIIAKTVKGKGVSFMEDQAGWHGKAPNDEEYKIAMEDLEKAGEALCQKYRKSQQEKAMVML